MLMKITARTGNVAGMRHIGGQEDVLLVTAQGMLIRTAASGIRRSGRATQGVKVINLEGDDRVVALARLAEPDDGGDEAEQEELF
jgi:DNA gyrase subunit A